MREASPSQCHLYRCCKARCKYISWEFCTLRQSLMCFTCCKQNAIPLGHRGVGRTPFMKLINNKSSNKFGIQITKKTKSVTIHLQFYYMVFNNMVLSGYLNEEIHNHPSRRAINDVNWWGLQPGIKFTDR